MSITWEVVLQAVLDGGGQESPGLETGSKLAMCKGVEVAATLITGALLRALT
jgi:hypothetical protein